ncbi:sulfotransferase domain-containing protein [Salinibacter ruber]|uniref:sulfotransferase domain-containing protein n=1 Tax=Salinibacter ruber TaxID=146919 RepID=UPI00355C6B29
MNNPTFVHIGAQRCGTTWMYKCISEHHRVFTPEKKELHYFNGVNYERGDEWYLNHFTPKSHHETWGEATPGYLSAQPEGRSVPACLAEMSPDCRIICCVRNPIDRAYSQWKRFSGDGEGPSFEHAIEENINNCLGRGLYAKHLERWFCHFPRDQMLIQVHEDVFRNNERAVSEVYRHIGVDPSYTPSWLGKSQNSVILPRVQRGIRRAGFGGLIRVAKRSPLGTWVRKIHQYLRLWKGAGYQQEMSKKTRQRLKEYFAEPNRELERLLGRELSGWPT